MHGLHSSLPGVANSFFANPPPPPPGVISAGDVFNQCLHQTFGDIPQFAKFVDDILVFTHTFLSQVSTTCKVLQRARQHGITRSPHKFEFAVSKAHFCRYTISRSGWTLDQDNTAPIANFPEPTNRIDLWSFLGLINQCSEFNSSLAQLAEMPTEDKERVCLAT